MRSTETDRVWCGGGGGCGGGVGGGAAERAESALVVGVMALPPVVQAADAVDVVARQDSGIGE